MIPPMYTLLRASFVLSLFSLTISLPAFSEFSKNSTVRIALRGEPTNLDQTKATDLDSFFILGHVGEGLLRFSDKTDGSVVPGLAETFTQKGLILKFKLRKGLKYHNGDPIRARDFVFAWQTVLKPKTASGYAFFLYPLKNGEQIAKGELPPESLGAKALDDLTLEVELEKPCDYFTSLLPYPAYFPLQEAFYHQHGSKYAAEADKILYSGPFIIKEWTHGSKLHMEKNPNYWNSKSIKIDHLNIVAMTQDSSARFNFYKDQKLDLLGVLGRDEIPLAVSSGYKLERLEEAVVWFLDFNQREGRPGRNLSLRQAVRLIVTDPKEKKNYLDKVIGIPGTKDAPGFAPPGIGPKTVKLDPIQTPKLDSGARLAQAKKLLEKARTELGGKVPPLTLIANDSPLGKREAEYFQELMRRTLGLEVKIDSQIMKAKISKMNAGDFDLASHNWSPDFPHPLAYLELKTSFNRSNRGRWDNKSYDSLIAKATQKSLSQAHQILIDEVGLLPTYQNTSLWLKVPNLKGVVRRTFGPDPDFSKAHYQ